MTSQQEEEKVEEAIEEAAVQVEKGDDKDEEEEKSGGAGGDDEEGGVVGGGDKNRRDVLGGKQLEEYDRSSLVLKPGAKLRDNVGDEDHLQKLMRRRRSECGYLEKELRQVSTRKLVDVEADAETTTTQPSQQVVESLLLLKSNEKKNLDVKLEVLKEVQEWHEKIDRYVNKSSTEIEIRLNKLSFEVEINVDDTKIKTVYNTNPIYYTRQKIMDIWKYITTPTKKSSEDEEGKQISSSKKGPKLIIQQKKVLDDISLVLKPGNMYLILGPPASGKTTLLKAISGCLSKQKNVHVHGSVEYNGLKLERDALLDPYLPNKKQVHIRNAISYVEQLDRHEPRMTVMETFDFAFQCMSGGSHTFGDKDVLKNNPQFKEYIHELDEQHFITNIGLKTLGLSNVADTFVGNADVRGVSGGQRRRVTFGEMIQGPSPVLCGDEVSTGLDAASTYNIIFVTGYVGKIINRTRVFSLLQPSPETVSCFDEVILLSEGRLLYAGPIGQVESYFASLGYQAPATCDVADFLQLLSTPDGCIELFHPPEGSPRTEPYTLKELADFFPSSEHGQKIQNELQQPWPHKWVRGKKWKGILKGDGGNDKKEDEVEGSTTTTTETDGLPKRLENKYVNSWLKSFWLNVKRNLLIWTRDRRFLIANFIKNVIMGVSVGGVFWQTEDSTSILGVLFQSTLFIMLGAMTAAPAQVAARVIYYKHHNANFYPPFPYVIGKAISMIPQALLDVFVFGTIIYYMVGLAPGANHYFTFIAILFVFTLVMNQGLSIFASIAPNASAVQGFGACALLFNVIFCGFILFPNIIPNYYIWIYWIVPLAWTYRALLVNEFQSDKWGEEGNVVLTANGFTHNGKPFGTEWISYSFAYLLPLFVLCVVMTGWGLIAVRADGDGKGGGGGNTIDESEDEEEDDSAAVNLPFTPVTMTFDDICYDVKASTGNEKIRLLNNASGIFQAGHMCALMGTSGAGKTTLMDCIALRKNTGDITGDVRLNGFPQETKTFRRCTGYVEQFDVQTSTLTVRESCLFSARLRLDSSNPDVASDEAKQKYVDQVLKVLELTPLADDLVGSDDEGGLSFEQRKRLSIAVELSGSPSIIFLDEPTSGLDARAALLVTKILRRIADDGRTVIATIHQPSSSVFELFDDLLLLIKGGRVVFHGDLGNGSCNLIKYFEEKGGEKITHGENPANWMLKVLGDGTKDFADLYKSSKGCEEIKEKIDSLKENPDPNMEIKFQTEFAAEPKTRRLLLNSRLQTIYARSPAYNLVRLMISAFIGFLLGLAFVTNRTPPVSSETEITSILATMFISFIITGVLSILAVLPVMLEIRDVFYRHEQAGMVSYTSLAVALGVAEQWFILMMGFFFCILFLPLSGIGNVGHFGSSVAFWGFFTLNLALYSYFGQAFMCCVKGMGTAGILSSVFIGLNNFFSGYIVRPQYLSGIFAITYWITPGHYVYEGMVVSIFTGDNRTVVASEGSDFYNSLGCTPTLNATCEGTVEDFVENFFGGQFPLGQNRTVMDALVLIFIMIIARGSTFLALKYFRYTSS